MKYCIAVLTKGYKEKVRYSLLIKRNKSIYNNIVQNSIYQFDIIIFHEGNILDKDQQYIRSHTPQMKLIFLNIKKGLSFNDHNYKVNRNLCPPNNKSDKYHIGYKHMCRFWSIDFIDYLEKYDYIIRIDEDCIVKYFDELIINYIIDNKIYFCSPHFINQDNKNFIVGMESFWNCMIKKYGIKSYIKNYTDIICPYTNFMIFDMNVIKNNQLINNILNEIDSCGCIYSNRWGDLPIWGMIMSTLFESEKFFCAKNIAYYHGSHHKYINKKDNNIIKTNLLDNIFLNNNVVF